MRGYGPIKCQKITEIKFKFIPNQKKVYKKFLIKKNDWMKQYTQEHDEI